MKIDVFVMGHLTYVVPDLKREYIGMEMPCGSTLSDVAEYLKIKSELILAFFVNRQKKDYDYIVQGGDKVSIVSPPAGG